MFDNYIKECDRLIWQFDKYIGYMKDHLYSNENWIEKAPENELVRIDEVGFFRESVDEILTKMFTKESSEYKTWKKLNEELNEERWKADKFTKEKEPGEWSSNFYIYYDTRPWNPYLRKVRNLLSNIQFHYQLEQNNKEEKPNVEIKIDKAIGSSIIGNGTIQGSIIGTQYSYASEQKQTLGEAAEELQKLLKELKQTDPNATEVQQIEHLNDETTPKFKRKVVAALKAATDTAIDEFLDNSYIKVGKAAIMGWMEEE